MSQGGHDQDYSQVYLDEHVTIDFIYGYSIMKLVPVTWVLIQYNDVILPV